MSALRPLQDQVVDLIFEVEVVAGRIIWVVEGCQPSVGVVILAEPNWEWDLGLQVSRRTIPTHGR
jgi:hypothetical protein